MNKWNIDTIKIANCNTDAIKYNLAPIVLDIKNKLEPVLYEKPNLF